MLCTIVTIVPYHVIALGITFSAEGSRS